MSPEQARGEIEGLDEQADVFALGAILCEILTGQPPYVGSRSQILEDAAAGRSTRPSPASIRAAPRTSWSGSPVAASTLRGAVRPRHAGVVAREVAALPGVGRRACPGRRNRRGRGAGHRRRRAQGEATDDPARLRARPVALTTGVAFAVIAERERRVRAEQSIAEVAALYRKADWFRDQARHIPPDQLDTWERALAQVRRTAEIVGAGAIDEETRKSVARLIDELKRRRGARARAAPVSN